MRLGARIARLESARTALITKRVENKANDCPIEWSRRFEQRDPANAAAAERARAVLLRHGMLGMLGNDTHVGHLALGLAMLVNAAGDEAVARDVVGQLLDRTKAYQAATGDAFPRPMFGL
ncbi:MAG: hypothetical protein K2W85_11420 [Phycisphaerales bacterium]|nr:hypothetical protein [Phycisphaerales bacterium]